MNALIVSEDGGFRSIIRNNCNRLGMRDVEEARSGTEAFNLLMAKPYSVLLVHGALQPSGAKFVEVLRKSATKVAGADHVPVVLIANEGATPQMVFEAADAGANYLAQLALSAQGLMKAMTIAVSQPTAFRDRANQARQKLSA